MASNRPFTFVAPSVAGTPEGMSELISPISVKLEFKREEQHLVLKNIDKYDVSPIFGPKPPKTGTNAPGKG